MKNIRLIVLAVCVFCLAPVLASATLYNIQLNGFEYPTFYGAAQTGSEGDVWNNPKWEGVPAGSATLFSGVNLVDSSGAESRVSATLTAAYNNNTNAWNDGGVFNRYEGRTEGFSTLDLMDKVVKVDRKKPDVNVMTLSLTGLPANAAVKVYVYGSGKRTGSGSKWSLDAANGGATATVIYDGSETGRDVTLATSQGLGWESLSGKTDASGKLTIIATAPSGPSGTVHWQTYMNGVQVEVSKR